MELKTYWRILIRRWWLVVVPVAVVALYTVVTYTAPAPTYQVVMRFAAGTKPVGLSEDYDRYYAWATSEYIANGLADAAMGEVFAREVASRLGGMGLDAKPADIQPRIVTDSDQSILVVYLLWPDSEQSVVVSEAIATELGENGATYFPQLEGVEPAVRLLDTPTPVPIAPGLRSQLMGPATKIGLALVVGIALALLWHYLDPTVHEAQELESMGLQVLGEMPRKGKSQIRNGK
jgi:capsular polysaccharide biosynthesis protein